MVNPYSAGIDFTLQNLTSDSSFYIIYYQAVTRLCTHTYTNTRLYTNIDIFFFHSTNFVDMVCIF